MQKTDELLRRVGLNEPPSAVVGKLGVGKQQLVEIAKALAQPNTKTRYEALGAEPVGLDNGEFKALLVNETQMLSGLIKEAKINID